MRQRFWLRQQQELLPINDVLLQEARGNSFHRRAPFLNDLARGGLGLLEDQLHFLVDFRRDLFRVVHLRRHVRVSLEEGIAGSLVGSEPHM